MRWRPSTWGVAAFVVALASLPAVPGASAGPKHAPVELEGGIALHRIGLLDWLGLSAAPEPKPFCDFPGEYAEWSDFTYRGVRMVVPRELDLMGRVWRGEVEGFNGVVDLDTFRPVGPDEHIPTTKGKDRFLARWSLSKFPSAARVAALQAEARSPENFAFGSEPPVESYPLLTGPHGLTEVAFRGTFAERQEQARKRIKRYPGQPHLAGAEVLYVDSGDDGEVATTILCDIGGSPVDLCRQRFRIEPFAISIGCVARELPRWQHFRDQSERLIACARKLGDQAARAD